MCALCMVLRFSVLDWAVGFFCETNNDFYKKFNKKILYKCSDMKNIAKFAVE